MVRFRYIFILVFLLSQVLSAYPQRVFTRDILLKSSPVKDQSNSSTCWSFATTSFIESELLRLGKGEYDLSEMFFVWHTYQQKAENYVRWQGNVFLTPGGQPHDVMNTIRNYGLMPQQAFRGKIGYGYGYNQSEMDTLIRNEALLFLAEGNIQGYDKLNERISEILKTYMGTPPAYFDLGNNKVTPVEFAKTLDFNPDDYFELTSYTNHKFYRPVVLETKYNWSHDQYYNIPYNEFFVTVDFALKKGYTVLWNGDVSENEFSYDYGIALVPEKKWENKTISEQKNTFINAEKEVKPSAELRQQTYENLESKVDHVMHIIGAAKDQDGKKYYIVKNSWGINDKTGGLIYMSDAYLKLKTISIMLHKDGIPKNILNKL